METKCNGKTLKKKLKPILVKEAFVNLIQKSSTNLIFIL